MHDGKVGYNHAIESVKLLKKYKKNIIIISNSSKRKNSSINHLPILGFDKNMLPIGLQIVGDMGKEFEVLQISKLFEDLFKWNELKAKISV